MRGEIVVCLCGVVSCDSIGMREKGVQERRMHMISSFILQYSKLSKAMGYGGENSSFYSHNGNTNISYALQIKHHPHITDT